LNLDLKISSTARHRIAISSIAFFLLLSQRLALPVLLQNYQYLQRIICCMVLEYMFYLANQTFSILFFSIPPKNSSIKNAFLANLFEYQLDEALKLLALSKFHLSSL
jgi:hypothetical protein